MVYQEKALLLDVARRTAPPAPLESEGGGDVGSGFTARRAERKSENQERECP